MENKKWECRIRHKELSEHNSLDKNFDSATGGFRVKINQQGFYYKDVL